MMIWLITIICFIAYNFVVFDYASVIFSCKRAEVSHVLIVSIFNAFLLVPIFNQEMYFSTIFMLVFVIVVQIEFMTIYKQPVYKALFGVMCFAVNFFAIRLLVASFFSLSMEISLIEIISTQENRLLITFWNFAIPVPYILGTRMLMTKGKNYALFLDNKNLIFACGAFLLSHANMMINASLIYSDVNTMEVTYIQIRTAIFSFILFVFLMGYVYIFSQLQQSAVKYTKLTGVIKAESEKLEELEEAVNRDTLTHTWTKSIAYNKIDDFLFRKKNFFVLFIDIDGLKYVNDAHGHSEGDFYITYVSQFILSAFSRDVVSRIGGDEFLVVGELSDSYKLKNKIMTCSADIEALAKDHNKEYVTSMSFGYVEVSSQTTMMLADIIKLADERMYEFKKANKRERGTIKVEKA